MHDIEMMSIDATTDRSGDYKKVPIAVIDDNQVNGSEEILKFILNSPHVQQSLERRWIGDGRYDDEHSVEKTSVMTMQQFSKSENALKWLKFATDDLAALLYPNICSSLSDSYKAFAYVESVDSFTKLQKVSIRSLGALAMYFAASKVKCEFGGRDISS